MGKEPNTKISHVGEGIWLIAYGYLLWQFEDLNSNTQHHHDKAGLVRMPVTEALGDGKMPA